MEQIRVPLDALGSVFRELLGGAAWASVAGRFERKGRRVGARRRARLGDSYCPWGCVVPAALGAAAPDPASVGGALGDPG